ncbi:MAG TPA: ATP-binding protein [Bacteroidia bacterium]|jgi:predicted kinase
MEQTHDQGFLKNLILIRGLPGSGKSTLAAVLSENGKYPIFSIDDFFTDPISGKYEFDPYRNHLAYKQCESLARKSMQDRMPKIFIDNTFTIEWEIEPYFKLAAEYGYRVFVITVENRHGSANIHDVPDEQLKKMAAKYKIILMP